MSAMFAASWWIETVRPTAKTAPNASSRELHVLRAVFPVCQISQCSHISPPFLGYWYRIPVALLCAGRFSSGESFRMMGPHARFRKCFKRDETHLPQDSNVVPFSGSEIESGSELESHIP